MPTKLTAVRTPNGEIVVLPVVSLGGESQVAGGMPSLSTALKAVDDFTKGLRSALKAVSPDRTTVEFSISFAMQAGKLTALFVDGTTEGAVSVTLEWDKE